MAAGVAVAHRRTQLPTDLPGDLRNRPTKSTAQGATLLYRAGYTLGFVTNF